ncbi:hypothetical protein EDB84DRAFT_968837 [Lactarius hengduanensis]|nr:hypothetical protein EDB84DRAFT_968837 [Lactarius hengduanensis]
MLLEISAPCVALPFLFAPRSSLSLLRSDSRVDECQQRHYHHGLIVISLLPNDGTTHPHYSTALAHGCACREDEARQYNHNHNQSEHYLPTPIPERVDRVPSVLRRRSLESRARIRRTSGPSVRHLACVHLPTFSCPFLLTEVLRTELHEDRHGRWAPPRIWPEKGRQAEGRVRPASAPATPHLRLRLLPRQPQPLHPLCP